MVEPLTRVTHTTLLVLHALTQGDRYGYEITVRSGMASGSVFPVLRRLEARGWITSHWETAPPTGRPRRCYYEFTEAGRKATANLLAARQQQLQAGELQPRT